MSECYAPTEDLGPEYVDTDGDGYAESHPIDTDHDGVIDTVLIDVDADYVDDVALFDNDPTDGEFVADVISVDVDGDAIADVTFDDLDFDGTFDAVYPEPGVPLADSNPYGVTYPDPYVSGPFADADSYSRPPIPQDMPGLDLAGRA